MIKYSLTLFSLLFITHFAQSQSFERSVVASSGGVANVSGSVVTWTLGETVINTAASGSVILTQGYQQPEQSTSNVKSLSALNGLKVYPNPSTGMFQLEAKDIPAENLQVAVSDASGKVVYQTVLAGKTSSQILDLSNLPGGIYLLKAADGNQLTNTFKITIIK